MANERLIQYDFTPALSPGDGPTSENGRVKQSELIANFDDTTYGIYTLRYRGVDATNRASDVNNCDIWLKTKSGGQLGCVAGEKAYIYYSGSTYMWTTDVAEAGGNPYIRFSDADCETPAVPAVTYNDAGFIDGLTIGVKPVADLVEKDRIIVVGAGALTGDNVARSVADVTKISTKITTLETQADSVIEVAGGLKVDVVEATNIKKTGTDAAFENDLPKNVALDGSCEKFVYRYDVAYGLDETDVPATSYAQDTATKKHGFSSQKFTTSAGGVGLKVLIDPEEGGITSLGAAQTIGKDLAGKKITLMCWYYANVADNVEIGFWDDSGAGYQVTSQTVAINTWTLLSVTQTIGVGATEVYGIIRSVGADATNHYTDAVALYPGETAFEVGQSVNASIVHDGMDNRFYNYIPFGDLQGEKSGNNDGHAWLDGDTSPPTGWSGDGTTAVDDVDYYIGERSWVMTLAAGESFSQYIGLAAEPEFAISQFVGRTVTFALWLKTSGANTEDIDLIIGELTAGWAVVATTSVPVNSYTDWQQVAVTGYISPTATGVSVRVKNNGGNPLVAKVDGLMFTQTKYPLAFTNLTPWQYIKFEFGMPGTVTDAVMNCQGITGDIPVGINIMVYGITVTEQTPAAGDDVFTVREGGAGTSLAVTLGNVEGYESSGDTTNFISAGDTIGVICDAAASGPGSDAFAVVHCLTWGI